MTAEPENTPSFSCSKDGANMMGSRFQLSMSVEETWPQCIGPHWVP